MVWFDFIPLTLWLVSAPRGGSGGGGLASTAAPRLVAPAAARAASRRRTCPAERRAALEHPRRTRLCPNTRSARARPRARRPPPLQAHVSNTYAHSDHKPPGPLLRLAHLATLAPVAALWVRWMMRIVSTYGAAPVLAGPVTGWLPLLALGWLRLSWRGPAGAGGGAREARDSTN